MRFLHVVLLALLALVVVSDTLAAATDSTVARIKAKSLRTMSTIAFDGIHSAGRLQGGRTVADSADTEDRGLTSLFRRMQVKYWIKTGKSNDLVKTALGIGGLSGNTLEASPMYKYYEKFLSGVDPRLNKWLNDGPHGLPTHLLWSDLGLNAISAAKRESSTAFKTYVRYATMYDDRLFQRVESGSNPLIIVGSFSDVELRTKISLLAKANRPDWYVKKILGLENKSDRKVAGNKDYKLFLMLKLKEPGSRWVVRGS